MRASDKKPRKTAAAWVTVLAGTAVYAVSMMTARVIVLRSIIDPQTAFQWFLNRTLMFLPRDVSLYSYCIFLFMCLVTFGFLFFVSKPNSDGVRAGMKCFGQSLGALLLFLTILDAVITGGSLPEVYYNFSPDGLAATLYTAPFLSLACIIAGNGGFKRRRVKLVCPECGAEVRAAKDADILCGECGVAFAAAKAAEKPAPNSVPRRLALAWDPDFTKVTPEETAAVSKAREEIERGEFVRHEDINWN